MPRRHLEAGSLAAGTEPTHLTPDVAGWAYSGRRVVALEPGHGSCIAAPGYSMYHFNVPAGLGGERSIAFCDDPTHHWIRDEWEGMPLDPRCPMVTADGPAPS